MEMIYGLLSGEAFFFPETFSDHIIEGVLLQMLAWKSQNALQLQYKTQ